MPNALNLGGNERGCSEQISNASPLSNVLRQVAGSLGIAIFTAIMGNRQIVHYQHISESVSVDSVMANNTVSAITGEIYTWAVDRATATGAATSYLAGFMQKEAFVRSIADTFISQPYRLLSVFLSFYFL